MGRLENQERLVLTKKDDKWTMSGGGTPDTSKMNDLTGALDSLKIVDVQPKPRNLTEVLKGTAGIAITQQSQVSLRQKGFFVTRRGLLANEGEIVVDSKNGLQYTLRFGEIASSGPSGDSADGSSEEDGEGERRYLFITVDYSEARAKQYNDGEEPDAAGQELADELRNRFADWYYVISGADLQQAAPPAAGLARLTPNPERTFDFRS